MGKHQQEIKYLSKLNRFLAFTCLQRQTLTHSLTMFFCLQLQWLNKYYETIRKIVGAELDKQGLKAEKEWMIRNTEPFIAPGSSASTCSSSLTIIGLTVAVLHSIIWASPCFQPSLHPQQTCTLMLHLCSLYCAAIPGWAMHCKACFFFF